MSNHPLLTLFLLMKGSDHECVFEVTPKIQVRCSFSYESDEETGDWPIPRKREVIYGSHLINLKIHKDQ